MTGYSPPFADSQILDLFQPGDLDRHETILRSELELDRDRAARGALNTAEARQLLSLPWWQRIFDERTGITTLSDHTRLDDVAGPLHTLYGRFSEREASLLRPWAKWLYLEKLLPDMRGKSVLEIGSSCGFWSFKFAELGAARVTGVEAIADHANNARMMAERKGVSDRVSFIIGDAFYDRIDRHDIVFHSEVLGHSLVPHHAFLRTLGLAKELVVADEYFGWDDVTNGQFFLSGDPDQGPIWTGYAISENAALTLCHLAGVDLSSVVRYRNHHHQGSALMFIPMAGAAERRAKRLKHVSQQMMVGYAMGLIDQLKLL